MTSIKLNAIIPNGGGHNCLWLSYWQSGKKFFVRFIKSRFRATNQLYRNSFPLNISRLNQSSRCCGVESSACNTFHTIREPSSSAPGRPCWICRNLRNQFARRALRRRSSSRLWRRRGGDPEPSSPAPFASNRSSLNIHFDWCRTGKEQSKTRFEFNAYSTLWNIRQRNSRSAFSSLQQSKIDFVFSKTQSSSSTGSSSFSTLLSAAPYSAPHPRNHHSSLHSAGNNELPQCSCWNGPTWLCELK